MSVLGVQLVITMVMLSVLSKISSRYSIARWLLSHKLLRYLPPSDDQIMDMANLKRVSSKKGKGGNKNKNHESSQDDQLSFKIPKNTEFVLECTKVRSDDLLVLKFYAEYQWIVDFAICAVVVFITTETYLHFFPKNKELNLSLIWCLLVLGFCFKLLMQLTRLYFVRIQSSSLNDNSGGERSLALTAGGFFFLIAMLVLIIKEDHLEFGLNTAYASFNSSAYDILERHGVAEHASGPLSKLIFKFWLAVLCGVIGGLFMFPGMRFGQMHKDCLVFMSSQRVYQVLLNMSFVSPLFILLLWIRPLGREYLVYKDFPGRGRIMTEESFESFRIIFIITVLVLRLTLMNKYLQSYLNLAPNRLLRLRKEAGTITNKELKTMINGVFYYLCNVCLQFLTPILMIFFTTLVYKVLGGNSWTGTGLVYDAVERSIDSPLREGSLRTVFTPILYRGLLAFIDWWLTFVWFTSSIIGFVYHSYYS